MIRSINMCDSFSRQHRTELIGKKSDVALTSVWSVEVEGLRSGERETKDVRKISLCLDFTFVYVATLCICVSFFIDFFISYFMIYLSIDCLYYGTLQKCLKLK